MWRAAISMASGRVCAHRTVRGGPRMHRHNKASEIQRRGDWSVAAARLGVSHA